MDLSMPGLNGSELVRRMKTMAPAAKLIVYSMHSDMEYVRDALKAGAEAYVSKGSPSREVLRAVRAVLSGQKHLSADLMHSVIDAYVEGAGDGDAPDHPRWNG